MKTGTALLVSTAIKNTGSGNSVFGEEYYSKCERHCDNAVKYYKELCKGLTITKAEYNSGIKAIKKEFGTRIERSYPKLKDNGEY